MYRRDFLLEAGRMLAVLALPGVRMRQGPPDTPAETSRVTLALAGDVMTGRGIDQVLAHPSRPRLYEPYVRDARRYVELAVVENGKIPAPVPPDYVWGEALDELARREPDLRIVNLETAVTTSADAWPDKGIHYRMHPKNVACLTAAGLDGVTLANNHTLDWGHAGLLETLDTLGRAGVPTAGAGRDRAEAWRPAVLGLPGGAKLLLVAVGFATSGIPAEWAATDDRPGIALLPSLADEVADELAAGLERLRRPGDRVLVSIHWGGNWGYDIPQRQQRFAHRLIDAAAVDVVHGHSSHHPKGIEVYRGRPILYGCGDFLNDYEGIGGHERYRGELSLLYFVTLERATGALARLDMVPFEIRRFRLRRASEEQATWLASTLDRESRKLGPRVELAEDRTLALRWQPTHRDGPPRGPGPAGNDT